MNEDELTESLKKTIAIIDQADVPTDLREEAFRAVWSALSGGPSATTAAPFQEQGRPIEASRPPTPWMHLSERLGVDAQLLEEVYELIQDGSFAVHMPTSALPKAKAAATRDLALLVCAGRQGSVEEWTAAETIRAVCADYGKFDSANHAANMAEGDMYWQISGGGRGRRYKLRRAGWEQARNIVNRITGS